MVTTTTPPFFELEMWVTIVYAGDCSVPTVLSGSEHSQRDFCYFVYCQDEAMTHWIFGSNLEEQHDMNECSAPNFNCGFVYQQWEFHTDATDKYWEV